MREKNIYATWNHHMLGIINEIPVGSVRVGWLEEGLRVVLEGRGASLKAMTR